MHLMTLIAAVVLALPAVTRGDLPDSPLGFIGPVGYCGRPICPTQ